MGFDISTESGVVLIIDDMVALLRRQDVKTATTVCRAFYEEVNAGQKKNFKPLGNLGDPTLAQLKKALAGCDGVLKKQGWLEGYEAGSASSKNWAEAAEGGMDRFCEALHDLWVAIIEGTRPDFPVALDEVRVFVWPSHCGWDVPIGKVCFIFNDHGLYEKILTAQGKKFEKIMGKIEVIKWTHMSY